MKPKRISAMINLTLDPLTHAKLTDLAKWTGSSKSAIVRESVRQYHRKYKRLETVKDFQS